MEKKKLQAGTIVKLYDHYNDGITTGIIVKINRIESFGKDGWISFEYSILTENHDIIHITESCIAEVLY